MKIIRVMFSELMILNKGFVYQVRNQSLVIYDITSLLAKECGSSTGTSLAI